MSSESDADEFYDAEDISPGRPKRLIDRAASTRSQSVFRTRLHHASSISSVGSASSITSDGLSAEGPIIDLEEEERKLLEAQRLEEERRRIEDEARQKRLEELQEKKKRQHEQALLAMQEAQKKAEANRLRRQKLAEARGIMADESTPPAAKPPPSLTGEETPLDTSLEACANFHSCMDVSANITESESIECAISRDESSDSLHDQNNSSESLGVENESSETLVSSELDEGENVNVNLNQPGKNGDKLQSKKIPEDSPVEHKDTNMEPVIIVEPEAEPEKPEETPVLVVTELDKHEPDIVKSVRGRPAELAQSMAMEAGPSVPVAPPRRKKKKAPSPIPEGVIAHSVSECSLQTMPIELPTPTTTVANLTKELEESLSLQSATSGNFLVTTQEEESSKAVRTADEEREDKRCYARLHALDFKSATLPSTFKKTPSSSPTEEKTSERPLSCDAGEAKCSKASETTEKTRSLERPRTASGSRYLTDKEILDGVLVLNLDTGETLPLSLAEDKLPRGINPLSLHIMRRTKEYSSDSSLHKGGNSDEDDHEESTKEPVTTQTISAVKPIKKRGIKIKRFLGKSVRKIKNKADGVLHHGDQVDSSDEEDDTLEGRRLIKIKASSHHKGPYDFDLLVPVQEVVGDHNATPGAIWTMKFSHCGRLLATGGQDNLLRVWVLKDAYAFFDDMRQKYTTKVSPTPSQDSLSSQSSEASQQNEMQPEEEDEHSPFMRRPFYVYKGHTADLLDISWSKNYFILSSSMDKTVRLWHVSRKECLCCFQHIDFVTAIAFHPRDDRYFLSGSLDGKLRLWNIPDKKVTLWNEVIGPTKLITAANFCNNGRFAVVGTYDGRCIFYTTDQLKYSTQIHVRSTRGKNSRGRKITGIEEAPGEDKILVTSNDSRIRLYNRRDLTLTCKYKGCANNSSQIKASFSSNGKYIICGSEDHFVYIWRTQHDFHQFTSARRDRNDFWEGIKAHQAVVTAAIFAPKPSLIIKSQFEYVDDEDKDSTPEVRGEVLVSADFSGQIKVFINKFKPGSGL